MTTIRDAYSTWATTYDHDRNRTRDLDAQVTRDLLAGRRGAVLELGCGTGKNTVFLAEIADSVRALDFSEGMLARARQKVTAPNVTFRPADLTQPWPVADAAIDLIVGNLVLEHLEDLAFVFREAARVLRPGGQFFLSELHPFRQYQGTQANFQQGEITTEIPAFTHHVSEFTGAAKSSGFTIEDLHEWWHAEDAGKPPRLLTLLLTNSGSGFRPNAK